MDSSHPRAEALFNRLIMMLDSCALCRQQEKHSGPGVPDALAQLRAAVATGLTAPPALASELAAKVYFDCFMIFH